MTKMFRDNNRIFVFLFSATYFALVATSSPEQGVWHLVTDKDHEFHSVKKSMFNGSRMIMKVKCDPGDPGNTYTDGQDVSSPASKEDLKIKISWMLLKTPCWNDYIFEEESKEDRMRLFLNRPNGTLRESTDGTKYAYGYIKSSEVKTCDHNIILNEVSLEKMIYVKGSSEGQQGHTAITRDIKEETLQNDVPKGQIFDGRWPVMYRKFSRKRTCTREEPLISTLASPDFPMKDIRN